MVRPVFRSSTPTTRCCTVYHYQWPAKDTAALRASGAELARRAKCSRPRPSQAVRSQDRPLKEAFKVLSAATAELGQALAGEDWKVIDTRPGDHARSTRGRGEGVREIAARPHPDQNRSESRRSGGAFLFFGWLCAGLPPRPAVVVDLQPGVEKQGGQDSRNSVIYGSGPAHLRIDGGRNRRCHGRETSSSSRGSEGTPPAGGMMLLLGLIAGCCLAGLVNLRRRWRSRRSPSSRARRRCGRRRATSNGSGTSRKPN